MQTQQMISPLQGIAPESIQIEPPASSHQDLLSARAPIENPLQIVPPTAVLVDLIEDPQLSRRQFTPEYPLAIRGDIPVEIPGSGPCDLPRQRRLAHLPGSRDENHLSGKILPDLWQQISRQAGHVPGRYCFFLPQSKNAVADFALSQKQPPNGNGSPGTPQPVWIPGRSGSFSRSGPSAGKSLWPIRTGA